jgi:hypothetical protein
MTQILSFKEASPRLDAAEPYLTFSNPGVLDINVVKLLGVSVKESDNPIGFFGTGLKYAIANTLRLGGQITIFADGERFDLSQESLAIRGKAFDRVTINGEPLGFTTELGKQWEPWMVVRELYSNALDENGEVSIQVHDLDDLQAQSLGQTIIVLSGEPFLEVWDQRADYFIGGSESPVLKSDFLDAYGHRCGGAIFYRGIKVYESRKPTLYRYNIKDRIDLTEDRTAKYSFQLAEAIQKATVTSQDAAFVMAVLTCDDAALESDLSFSDSGLHSLTMSHTFQSVCADLAHRKPRQYNRKAVQHYLDRTQASVAMTPVPLSAVQQKQLTKATDFIRSLGFADALDDYPINVVTWLGERVYGMAENRRIYLTKQAFDLGTKKLAAIILEEFVHCHFRLYDETREMQSWLFERVITMGEEFVAGEPL